MVLCEKPMRCLQSLCSALLLQCYFISKALFLLHRTLWTKITDELSWKFPLLKKRRKKSLWKNYFSLEFFRCDHTRKSVNLDIDTPSIQSKILFKVTLHNIIQIKWNSSAIIFWINTNLVIARLQQRSQSRIVWHIGSLARHLLQDSRKVI